MAWRRSRDSSSEIEPNLQEFIVYFLMPIAADGRLEHIEETPLQTAMFVYGLDALFERNAEVTAGALRQAIRAARQDPSLVDRWNPQEAWNSINRQLRAMTECEYWYVQVWLETEAIRLGRPFEARTRPGRFATASEKPNLVSRIAQWIVATEEEEASPSESAAAKDAADDAATAETDDTRAEITTATVEEKTAATTVAPAVDRSTLSPPELTLVAHEFDADQVDRLVRETLDEAEFTGPVSRRAEEIVAGIERLLASDSLPGLAFDECRNGPANQAVVVDRLPANADVWFIGDLHGDLLSLLAALETIDAVSRRSLREPTIVLLGDLFDRGPLGCQTVLRVFYEMLVRGGQVCLLAGNHDESLAYREPGDTFVSSVSPFEMADWLNVHRCDVNRRLGRAIVGFFRTAPRALFLPDGLLAAHGGVPLRDLSAEFADATDLDRPACLQDFVWTRANPRARFKYINRNSRTCEFGYEDFEFFCARAGAALGRPIQRMLRGHDHVEDRFLLYDRYVVNPVLTITTMCCAPDEMGPYERWPCIARWVRGGMPEVHQLRLPAEAVRRVYPPPAESMNSDDQ